MAGMDKRELFTVEDMLELPRLSGLRLSPDGSRLVVGVSRPDAEGKKMVSALYELDPRGEAPPRRLTRSASGESGAVFAPDGSLLFISRRSDPDAGADDPGEDKPALWMLPAKGGESHLLAGPPGGVDAVAVARESEHVLFAADSHPETPGWEEDAEREKARKDAGVGAQLFSGYPIRFWDHYLGPRERHLHLAPTPEGDAHIDGEDLIPNPGRSFDNAAFDITPDGSTVVATRWRQDDEWERYTDLIAIAAGSGEVRELAREDAMYNSPVCSPDGRLAVAVRREKSTPQQAGDTTLWLVDLATGEGRNLLPGLDLWPQGPVWAQDSSAVFFTADEDGRSPAFRVDMESGAVTRLSAAGAFSDLCPSPDGRTVYALRSTISEPPHPVALDARAEDSEPRSLRSFEELDGLELSARVERVTTEADDGTKVPSWLVLPEGASAEEPAPLATFIHGGPWTSWNSWHWRWNPHVFLSEGWAVLLPDPALSTGYGIQGIQRGLGRWGSVVYEDVMRAVDGALARDDLDESRTVAMGGSFGGYMSNWIAGHTDRFDAIVTHASVWDLEAFRGTTDLAWWWEREFGDPFENEAQYRENSPHLHVKNINTPMLVIHGEQDYRVPVSETLTLWADLKRAGVPAKFLYFPDENHWIMKPNNARIWYETVLAFIAHHALGREWKKPELL
jgi:dipeptidyl aminopeptidase/acylaminoacyl peptidase